MTAKDCTDSQGFFYLLRITKFQNLFMITTQRMKSLERFEFKCVLQMRFIKQRSYRSIIILTNSVFHI